VCCGRTPSGCARPWKLSHPGRTVVCGHSRLLICASEWPKSRVRVALSTVCVPPYAEWGGFEGAGTPVTGLGCPKQARQGQNVSIEGTDRHPGTSECVFVRWCGCSVLLWALLIPVEGETLTGQAPRSLLTHALARQCMYVAAGFDVQSALVSQYRAHTSLDPASFAP